MPPITPPVMTCRFQPTCCPLRPIAATVETYLLRRWPRPGWWGRSVTRALSRRCRYHRRRACGRLPAGTGGGSVLERGRGRFPAWKHCRPGQGVSRCASTGPDRHNRVRRAPSHALSEHDLPHQCEFLTTSTAAATPSVWLRQSSSALPMPICTTPDPGPPGSSWCCRPALYAGHGRMCGICVVDAIDEPRREWDCERAGRGLRRL